MSLKVVWGLLIPFIGTSAGAGCVFFMKRNLSTAVQRALTGFAAGVMVAASVWSLIIPAMEQTKAMGRWAFVPVVIGFWIGILFLLLLDTLIPHLHINEEKAEGPKSGLPRTTMMVLAVTLHNIPEGMAVGIVYAGLIAGSAEITAGGALALALGIAIQNFPEGVEPVFGGITILIAGMVIPAMPYFLSFAAGAMIYVVVEELIPSMYVGEHSNVGVISFAFGFTVMMALDVALG